MSDYNHVTDELVLVFLNTEYRLLKDFRLVKMHYSL